LANHIATKFSITTFFNAFKNAIYEFGGNPMPKMTWIASKFKKGLYKRGWSG
jgi:hypothetical protein